MGNAKDKLKKRATNHERADRQLSAAQGEAIVLYELMWHGWIPANVNQFVKNARNIDVVAIKDDSRQVALSIKTSGRRGQGNIQLGGKTNELAFNRHIGAKAEFVVFVLISDESSRGYRCFVVPTAVAEKALQRSHKHWMSHPRVDGAARKPGIRMLCFFGKDTPTRSSNNFAEKWARYEDAWGQLNKARR